MPDVGWGLRGTRQNSVERISVIGRRWEHLEFTLFQGYRSAFWAGESPEININGVLTPGICVVMNWWNTVEKWAKVSTTVCSETFLHTERIEYQCGCQRSDAFDRCRSYVSLPTVRTLLPYYHYFLPRHCHWQHYLLGILVLLTLALQALLLPQRLYRG